tara:strand:+ start:3840 stop:4439 length:600 start_codon:yes stop_codon:yes gene_type:complete
MTPWGSYEDKQLQEYTEKLIEKNAHRFTDQAIWERSQQRVKELQELEDHGVITHEEYLEQIHHMPLHKNSLLYAVIKEVAEEAWNEVWLEEDPLNIEEDLLEGLFEEEKPVHPVVANFEEFKRLLKEKLWSLDRYDNGAIKKPAGSRWWEINGRVQSHIVFNWRVKMTIPQIKAYLKQNNIPFKNNLRKPELRALLHTF